MTPSDVAAVHPGIKFLCADCRKVAAILGIAVDSRMVFASVSGEGICHRCGFREDLRMGSCFRCADFVKGKNHGDGIHELWDSNRPDNRWFIWAR